MTGALALLAPLLVAQDASSVPPSPFDEVHVLELAADDPALIEGLGPTQVVELEVAFDGTLHVWTRSELDLSLRVDDALEARELAADDDSGGGATPYLRLEISEGDRLAVLVAGEPGASGSLTLHLIACPESEASRAKAVECRQRLEEIGALRNAGDLGAAREATRALVEGLSSFLGAGHSQRIADTLSELGFVATGLGDLASARAARSLLRDALERTLPADHRDLLDARNNLATTLYEVGDLPGACALMESALAGFERTLPEDDRRLLVARLNLASARADTGDLSGARALEEAVLEACERTLPADHPDLLVARRNLAATMKAMGDLPGARALEEAVLVASERILPADHPGLVVARQNLAATMWQQGELTGARAMLESVLEARERTLPEDHPDLIAARQNLAVMMREMGDLLGARALLESVLEGYERTLPPDHPSVLRSRLNLAVTLKKTGDLPGARALEESALAGLERTLPADHTDLLRARGNLAGTMQQMGDLDGARALFEAVLEGYGRALPEDHPDVLHARYNLAAAMRQMGDLDGARALLETGLADFERRLTEDHPDLLHARAKLAVAMWQVGDRDGARELVGPQVAGMRARVLGSLALAPRQAREAVGAEAKRLTQALFLTRGADADLQARVFELQETMRMVAGEAARALRAAEDPEIRAVLEEAGTVRAALGDLASRSAGRDPVAFSAELTRLLQERDRLEREAGRRLAARDVVMGGLEIGPLARGLGEGAALVAYRRIPHWYEGDDAGRVLVGDDHLLVHVITSGGSLRRIDLGEAAELEELVLAWRRALGRPLRGRGVTLDGRGATSAGEQPAAEALRRRLVDPVLAALGDETDTLHVCADDLVFLVPLDALALEDGVLGDRYRFVNEVSSARLVSHAEAESAEPGLLLLGGVDYDAGTDVGLRSGATGFGALPGTRAEADALRRLFGEAFDAEGVLLADDAATKDALAAAVPGKRWLHLATHGWFADTALKSALDEEPGQRGWTPMGVRERVGMAPMLLCGLALSGANRGRDSLGRTPGLLTAEELCSLDLAACDLAVLSACETNVGVRRAGQGIQSLQAALYAAGARSSITSLWKVDDDATRRLFELFYTHLWEDGLPKAEALWRAKRALREEGAPVRDWAAWVLTGDPQ